MPYQNLSATVSPDELQEIKDAIAALKAKLPFLISLTNEERQRLFKMGDKSVAFVLNSRTAAQNNPNIFPSSLDLDEFDRDCQLVLALSEILTLLRQLTEEVDDTLVAVGSEAMSTSLTVYDYFKTAAKKTPGLKSVVDQLGDRFRGLGPRRARLASTSPPPTDS